jgi:hypothetical protein
VNWRAYAIRFGVAQGFRWYARSGRTPTTKQLGLFMLIMPFVAAAFLGIEAVWVLTGSARRIRHALGHDEIQVIPGPRGLPPAFRRRLDEVTARQREEFERMKAELGDAGQSAHQSR